MRSLVVLLVTFSTVVNGFTTFRPHKVWTNLARSKRGTWMTATEVEAVATPQTETYSFESNVSRVMDIIINSLYSNKDVFLRELISNAADACDKKRFRALTSGTPTTDALKIRIAPNRERNTLTIEDRGIGMNKNELIQNLGKIAESGTKKFLEEVEKNQKKDDISLIGQFGVGFYSGFLVANKMEVVSKGSAGETYRWEASANSLDKYTVTPIDTESGEYEPIEGSSGTRIILHLKDESDQYLDDIALKALIEKYSEFIPFPIELQRNVSRPETVPDIDAPPEADGSIPMKTITKKVLEWSTVNDKKPLWLRRPKECAPDEYTEFYKQTFRAYDEPLSYSHFAVEGNVDFKALLFLPSEIPYELTRDMFASSARAMKLYVKRVFINDKFEDLIPRWLLFLRGIVDSEDLPLNVGREILQQSRSLRIIKQRLVKKSLEMFENLALKNETEYCSKFWKNYGKYVKVGLIEDEKNREDLIPLTRFYSSYENSSTNGLTSLQDYVKRMKEDQKNIYYVVGETKAQAAMSPALEKLKAKQYEILYISEPLDEMTLQNIEKVDGKTIVDVGKEVNTQDLSEEEKQQKEKSNESLEGLRNWMKEVLGDRITRVEASTRLVDSPATIVQSEYGISPNMQKYLRAQSVQENDESGGGSNFKNIFNQAVLELNPNHPIIQRLKEIYEKDPQSEEAKERVNLLFDTAALAAGYLLDNSADYAKLVVNLLSKVSTN